MKKSTYFHLNAHHTTQNGHVGLGAEIELQGNLHDLVISLVGGMIDDKNVRDLVVLASMTYSEGLLKKREGTANEMEIDVERIHEMMEKQKQEMAHNTTVNTKVN